MNVIAVDDEELLLDDFVSQLESMSEIDSVRGFLSAEDAIKFVKTTNIDVAFLDIQISKMNGIMLAKKLKFVNPKINIIFLTAYSEYALEAMEIHASGYLLKPPTDDDIRNELLNLRNPLTSFESSSSNLLNVHCFGNFEVYVGKTPCEFRYTKTKELFAYLIDRKGALCTNGEIMAVLWENKEVSHSLSTQLRNLISDMRLVFKKSGNENIIVKKRGQLGIDVSKINCDYYDWLNGKKNSINSYSGEYMTQYSWAEFTHGNIVDNSTNG